MILKIRDTSGELIQGKYQIMMIHQSIRSLSRIYKNLEPCEELELVGVRPYHVYNVNITSDNYRPVRRFVWSNEPYDYALSLRPDRVTGPILPAACAMNIQAKAKTIQLQTGLTLANHIVKIFKFFPDRIWCKLSVSDPKFEGNETALFNLDPQFEEVPGVLHSMPNAIRMGSWKTREDHGSLQVTLFWHDEYKLCADIDIDLSDGLEHFFHVVKNHLTGSKTHPYDVREVLMMQGIDPGYRLEVRE